MYVSHISTFLLSFKDGDEHLSSQNETFKDVMTKRNISHSQAVFEKYKKVSFSSYLIWRKLSDN